MMQHKDLALFCQRMGIGLKAGVDIVRLIENEQKSGNGKHRQIVAQVRSRIQRGDTLSEAMAEHPRYFPALLVQMVHASELGGRMDSIFAFMGDYYQQLKQVRNNFWQRISWPLIQLVMAIAIIGVVILLQGILSPQATYDATSLGLRGTRGFVIYCVIVAGVLGGIGLVSYGVLKNWLNCHRVLVPLVQRLPKIGTAITTLGLSRLSATLSMLLNAGVDAKQAIQQAFLATGNHYFIGGMQRAIDAIEHGATFGDAFEQSAVLPSDFIDAIRIGEISGTETESMDHLARQYQQQAVLALGTIANLASAAVWLAIVCLIVFMIIRMALQYIMLLNNTLQNPMGG